MHMVLKFIDSRILNFEYTFHHSDWAWHSGCRNEYEMSTKITLFIFTNNYLYYLYVVVVVVAVVVVVVVVVVVERFKV